MRRIKNKLELIEGFIYLVVLDYGETKVLKYTVMNHGDEENPLICPIFVGNESGWGEVKVCDICDAYMIFELEIT